MHKSLLDTFVLIVKRKVIIYSMELYLNISGPRILLKILARIIQVNIDATLPLSNMYAQTPMQEIESTAVESNIVTLCFSIDHFSTQKFTFFV